MKKWMRFLRSYTALVAALLLMGSLGAWAAEDTENGPITVEFTLGDYGAGGMPIGTADFRAVRADTQEFYYGRAALAGMSNGEALLYAYDAIVEGVENGEVNIPVADGSSKISTAEVQMVYNAYSHDHAEVFWLGNTYWVSMWDPSDVIEIIVSYIMEGDTLEAARAAFDAAAEEVLAGIDEDMTEFEKELYLHDVLAEKVIYAESTNAHNAYGALVEGVSVCEGYAEAFQTLLHRVGIRSLIVTGTGNGGLHAWNMVQIDGEYYHVDLTWNDQDIPMRSYFNVTDAVICEDHTIDVPAYGLPACTAEDANYFTVNGGALSAFDAEVIARLLKENDLTAHVYLTGGLTMESFWQQLNSNMHEILGSAGIRGGYSCRTVALGREFILQVIPDGLSATVSKTEEDSLTVTVRGSFGYEITADLYAAVYDADGRMIGIAKADAQTLTSGGSSYTVDFSGDADIVRAFAVNGAGVPVDAAVELKIR